MFCSKNHSFCSKLHQNIFLGPRALIKCTMLWQCRLLTKLKSPLHIGPGFDTNQESRVYITKFLSMFGLLATVNYPARLLAAKSKSKSKASKACADEKAKSNPRKSPCLPETGR